MVFTAKDTEWMYDVTKKNDASDKEDHRKWNEVLRTCEEEGRRACAGNDIRCTDGSLPGKRRRGTEDQLNILV